MIRLENISMIYGNNGTRSVALRDISLAIDGGEYVAISGESGAGKSTLLAILGGLQVPTSGLVVIAGRDLSALSADGLADFRRDTIGSATMRDRHRCSATSKTATARSSSTALTSSNSRRSLRDCRPCH